MHIKWQGVYFDITSAADNALHGSMSVSKSMNTYSFSLEPRIKSTDEFGWQGRSNFGLGEGEMHNCSDTDIDANERGSLGISFIELFTPAFN